MNRPDDLLLFLVEDEALIAMDLEILVEELGHRVGGLAASVEEAISLLEGLSSRPDAAIVDANLGGESARPVVEFLEALEVPTLIASGYESAELERMGLRGASIRKPYSRGAIAEALASLLDVSPDR